MKLSLFIPLFLITSTCFAQKQNVYFLKYDGAAVTTRDSADFIRIVREPDTGTVNFKVLEYYKNGKIKLGGESSTIEPLTFEGWTISYFPDGKRSATDQFNHGVRKVSCTYYSTGKLRAIREYPEALANVNKYKNFTLTTYNDTTGKALVTDGNGDFAGFEIEMNDRYAEGKIVNGKKEGVWKGSYPTDKITFVEEYHEGNLLTGTCTTANNKKYTYHTEVALLNVGYPDGPTRELAKSSDVVPEPAPVIRAEITSGTITHTLVSVPAGSAPPTSSRINMPSTGGTFGSTPNIANLQEHGTVIVSFTIDKSGRTIDAKITKSLNEDLDRSALKMVTDRIRMNTGNKPAILLGKPIETRYVLPVTF
jgi:TonB family protein